MRERDSKELSPDEIFQADMDCQHPGSLCGRDAGVCLCEAEDPEKQDPEDENKDQENRKDTETTPAEMPAENAETSGLD